jgi:choline dehydrogenase-like flavoprotein
LHVIPSYTYAWDSDANTVGINLGGSAPINITYDAFDRAVEQNSGTYKQILYSPVGKLALMQKQVTLNVFLPLPGGEQATYTGSTIRFRHYDWLGSARFESNMAEAEYGDVAYAPFGETYSIKNTPYLSFTGQQRDTISGLKSAEMFEEMMDAMKELSNRAGGEFLPSFLWAVCKRLLTAHPLGGCVMSDSPDTGVVNDRGEVYGHPGLYVCDGAIIPGPLSVNPSLTIGATAERVAYHTINGYELAGNAPSPTNS